MPDKLASTLKFIPFCIICLTLALTKTLDADQGSTVASAETLTIGSTVEASIESAGDLDLFVFTLTEPSNVSIFSTGSTDTWAELYNSSFTLVTYNDDASDSDTNFLISETLENDTYYLQISGGDLNTTTGDYTLVTTGEAKPVTATMYLMTTSTSTNVTSLHVINDSSSSQHFTGTLYDSSGAQLGSTDQPLHQGAISPNGRVVLSSASLEDIFGVDPWSGPAMLDVKGSDSFKLMSKLISPSGLVSNTNCVRESHILNIEGFDSTNRSYVRFINTTEDAFGEIRGTLYDPEGDIIGNADVVLFSSLGAKAQSWINRDQFADRVGSQWTGEAALRVSDTPGLKLLNLNYVNDETFFNFSCFQDSDGARVYLQTTSTSANISSTHIVNTSDSSLTFSGTLYNFDGEQLGEAGVALNTNPVAPNGRLVISSNDLESLFGVDAWKGPAMLEVTADHGFALMTKLTSPSGLISNSNCVARNTVHNIEGSDDNGRTYVRFINQGNGSITNVTGNLYDLDGAALGREDVVLIDALESKQAKWIDRQALNSLFDAEWSGEASLVVSATNDTGLRVLNLNYVNDETFFNFSCYESSNQPPVLIAEYPNQTIQSDSEVSIPVDSSAITDSDDNDTLSMEVVGLPDGLNFNGSTIEGSLTDAAIGKYTIQIIGTDESLAATSSTFELTVIGDGWTENEFLPQSSFAAQCANPRSGFDPFTFSLYPDTQGTVTDENNWLRSWTHDLYLWYGEVVDRDPSAYQVASLYFDLMKTENTTPSGQPKDNFHFSADTEAYLSSTQLGESFGYGWTIAVVRASPPREVIVTLTQPDTPASDANITRGARITAIDGVDMEYGNDVDTLNNGLGPSTAGESHQFTIQDLGSSSTRTVSLTAQTIVETQVQNVSTIDTASGKVGYMLFTDHNAPSEELLINAFTQLRDEGVTDLVFDLRYNPGGLIGIAAEVGFMIAGRDNTIGKTFTQLEYNDKYVDFDPYSGDPNTPIPFVSSSIGYSATPGIALPSLDLDRVFVLTTAGTCSASELIMNALVGIDIEVIQIGGTTCGKPYGFLPEDNCGTTYFSIQSRAVNAKGYGEYSAGFTPTTFPSLDDEFPGCVVGDDYTRLLGDPDEGLFSAALYYRDNSSCPPTSARLKPGTSHLRSVMDFEILRQPWENSLRADEKLRRHIAP